MALTFLSFKVESWYFVCEYITLDNVKYSICVCLSPSHLTIKYNKGISNLIKLSLFYSPTFYATLWIFLANGDPLILHGMDKVGMVYGVTNYFTVLAKQTVLFR